MSSFDYVQWDDQSEKACAGLKSLIMGVEAGINATLLASRSRSLAITKLDETFMWIGRAIRDDQMARKPILEEFKNG